MQTDNNIDRTKEIEHMYLKFVTKNSKPVEGDDNIVTLVVTENTYECDHFTYHDEFDGSAIEGKEHEFACFYMHSHNIQQPLQHSIHKPKTTIYVMNVNGKTIDTYVWRMSENGDRVVRM